MTRVGPRLDSIVEVIRRDSATPRIQERLDLILGVPPPRREDRGAFSARGGVVGSLLRQLLMVRRGAWDEFDRNVQVLEPLGLSL